MRGVYSNAVSGSYKTPFVIKYEEKISKEMVKVPYLRWCKNIYGNTGYQGYAEDSYETLDGFEIGLMVDKFLRGIPMEEVWKTKVLASNSKLRNRASYLAILSFGLKVKKFINTLTNPKLFVSINAGEIDLIDDETIYDIKVTRGEVDDWYWQQLYGYYFRYKQTNPEHWKNIKYLAIINPRKDKIYKHKIPKELL